MKKKYSTVLLFIVLLFSTLVAKESRIKWYTLLGQGVHFYGSPDTTEIRLQEAHRYFDDSEKNLSRYYRDEILPLINLDSLPEDFRMGNYMEAEIQTISVAPTRVSETRVELVVHKYLGRHLWHGYFQALAVYHIERDSIIDEMFNLNSTYNKLSYTYKGIGHGTLTESFMKRKGFRKLGKPDYTYTMQAHGKGIYYYEKEDLEVFEENSRVHYIQHGRPYWVDLEDH